MNVSGTRKAPCSPPFELVGDFGCFYLGSEQGWFVDNYDAAVTLCQGHGGQLTIVDTEVKHLDLRNRFILDSKLLASQFKLLRLIWIIKSNS